MFRLIEPWLEDVEALRALEAKVTDEHVWLKGARATLAELETRGGA